MGVAPCWALLAPVLLLLCSTTSTQLIADLAPHPTLPSTAPALPPTRCPCFAGCPAAVANLWDVTDKDIDRFSQAVLTSWISGSSSGGSSSGGSGSSGGSARGSSASEAAPAGSVDMSVAVAAARAVCKLPHLVGAAPVCYGLPARMTFG